MVTNLTNITDAKNFFDLVEYSNNVTGGVLGWMLVIVLMSMLTLMFLQRYSFEESILGASFLCFVISFFLRFMELITFTIVISLGIVLVFSGFGVYLSKK